MENSYRDGNTRPSCLSPEKPVCGSRTWTRIVSMEQLTGSRLRKEYDKSVYCHPIYLTCTQTTSCEMLGWMSYKLKSRLLGEISTTLDVVGWYHLVDDTTLMAESKEELNNLLMRVMEENEKAGLKLNIKKTKTMASGSITSWQIEGEKVEAVTDFLFLGSKITADGDCSHEIRWLVLGRKTLTNLDSVLKSRHQFVC